MFDIVRLQKTKQLGQGMMEIEDALFLKSREKSVSDRLCVI